MQIPHLAGVDEFLRWEAQQEQRYEFAEGEVSCFPGATPRHDIVQTNVKTALRAALGSAHVFGPEVKLVVGESSRYPDVLVTLDPRDSIDRAYFCHPTLVIEVLSHSTSPIDRGSKLDEYRSIETLREYVLIDSVRRWVQTVRRAGDHWIMSLPMTSGTIQFEAVGVAMTFDEIYAGAHL